MDSRSKTPPIGSVLVAGAGIAGIQASLDLADSGYKVYLLESSPSIGGAMAQLDKTFPTNDCSMCILSPKVVECARHLNIDLMTLSEIESVEGEAGDFTVHIRTKPRYIDPDRCIACGACARVCPVELPSVFDEGMGTRKAAYRPFPQAVPNIFAIDKRGTSPCKAACPAGTSVQGFVSLIAAGQERRALDVSRRSNPFAGVCGYVCGHPCEIACSRQLVDDEAVSIRVLERYLAEWGLENPPRRSRPAKVTREHTVGIVGSGPTALTAAVDLANLGYAVVAYERSAQAGGSLREYVDECRVPEPILDAEIARIEALGVGIRLGESVGDLAAIREAHDVLLLADGNESDVRAQEDLPDGVLLAFEGAALGGVAEAVGAGHRAAEAVHRHLTGDTVEISPRIDGQRIVALSRKEAVESIASGSASRVHRTAPSSPTLAMEDARGEAERCLNCGRCSECYRCADVCPADAVNHSMGETHSVVHVGAIVLSTGYDTFDAAKKYELGYSRFQDVVTSIEFERLLSASGPCAGHPVRPSDGADPRRIAFLQCVGSRDRQCGNEYCSSVCCMYAIKEAIIAKEHDPAIEATIFYMDVRAFGKDFDRYYERARDEYGLRFVASRVATVDRQDDGTLDVAYVAEDDDLLHEAFDLVVLSVGLEPSAGTRELIETLGLRHGEGGFCYGDEFRPLASSRDGIYVCGAANGPMDIPDTVTQASGAAAEVGALLAGARGTLTEDKTYPTERDTTYDAPRVGVFVCHCGVNIAGVVDVESVAEYATTLPYVAYAGTQVFACSQDALESLKDTIRKHDLNRVVVASCSPRTHEPLFQETIREVGLNPYLFELANIRDQCSWVHAADPPKATEKSKDLVRMAVNRVVHNRPLHGQPLPITHSALVLGGGIAGMAAATVIADQGYDVHLVEREDALGGNARHTRATLRNRDVPERLAALVESTRAHPRVHVHTSAQVRAIEGFVGNFRTALSLKGDGEESAEETIEHGVIILATGAEERATTSFLYGQDARVITQRQLEESLADGTLDLPEGRPATVVMIQCVDSRNEEHPYCSRVCCSHAIKNAIALKEQSPEANVFVLYRDIRTYGLRERYYQQARELGVVFIRYDLEPGEDGVGGLPQVALDEGRLTVRTHDRISGQDIVLDADRLVLSVGIAPRTDADALATMLKVPRNEDGFFLEAHMKLRPVEFATEGIYLAGLAHSPKFIQESVAQAQAAASRAITVLSQDHLMSAGSVAIVDQLCCVACGDCEAVCPYGAIDLVEIQTGRRTYKTAADVNPALCKACGLCAAACRSGCIQIEGFDDVQIMAQIEALVAS